MVTVGFCIDETIGQGMPAAGQGVQPVSGSGVRNVPVLQAIAAERVHEIPKGQFQGIAAAPEKDGFIHKSVHVLDDMGRKDDRMPPVTQKFAQAVHKETPVTGIKAQ